MRVPYLARFHLYARQYSKGESVMVRALCITEPDRAEHPLELQEDFGELCHSEDVEIYDKTEINIKFGGNLLRVPVISAAAQAAAASGMIGGDTSTIGGGDGGGMSEFSDDSRFQFRPFSDNRKAFVIRRKNDKNPYTKGRVTFFTGMDKVLYEAKIDLTKFL